MLDQLTELAKAGARVVLTLRGESELTTTLRWSDEAGDDWPVESSIDMCWDALGFYGASDSCNPEDIIAVRLATDNPAPPVAPKVVQIAAYSEGESCYKGLIALGSDGSMYWMCENFVCSDWTEVSLPPGFVKS